MSPKPIIENSQPEYEHDDERCRDCGRVLMRDGLMTGAPFAIGDDHLLCEPCASAAGIWEEPEDTPQMRWRPIRNAIICSAIIFGLLALAGLAWVHAAQAREGAIHPIPIPAAHAKARAVCPLDKPLKCRAALVHAYEAVAWQRRARWHAQAKTSSDVVRNAITWASKRTGVPVWRLTAIGRCESHLFFLAHNGQYLGVWQLGATHRSDPIFRVVPWMDPYAQAIHVARFIRAHGESQWQCTSTGGLRW